MNTILVCVDFSDVTPRVVEQGRELARAFGRPLRLLHVARPEPDFIGYDPGPQTVRTHLAHELRDEHRQLQAMADELRAAGHDVEALLVQGPSIEKIVEEARRLHAAMIVIGSHGHGALYDLLLGSVSEGVVRAAPCPVLVVPARQQDPAKV